MERNVSSKANNQIRNDSEAGRPAWEMCYELIRKEKRNKVISLIKGQERE